MSNVYLAGALLAGFLGSALMILAITDIIDWNKFEKSLCSKGFGLLPEIEE